MIGLLHIILFIPGNSNEPIKFAFSGFNEAFKISEEKLWYTFKEGSFDVHQTIHHLMNGLPYFLCYRISP